MRISVLRIIETSWPVPDSPKLGSNSDRNRPATILLRLACATDVIVFLLIASFTITGVLGYNSKQISDNNSVKTVLRLIVRISPQ